ncbi:unnamed protein product, partial [Polarella glacialis]
SCEATLALARERNGPSASEDLLLKGFFFQWLSWCLKRSLNHSSRRITQLSDACERAVDANARHLTAMTASLRSACLSDRLTMLFPCWTAWRKQLSSLRRGTQLALHFARAREQRGPVMLELAFVSWAHAAKEERCSRETADAQVLAKEAALAHTRRSMALNSFTQLAAGRSEATGAVLAWQAWRSACYRGRLRAAETCRLLERCLQRWQAVSHKAAMQRQRAQRSSADWQLLRLCLQSWCLAAALDREAELKVACESSAGAYAERSAAVTSYFNRALEATQSVALQKQCWTAWRKQLSSLRRGTQLALHFARAREQRGPVMLELAFVSWAHAAKEERCSRETADAQVLAKEAALAHTRRSMALNSFTQLVAGRSEATAAVLAWQAWRSACYRGRLRAVETCRLLERCLQRWQAVSHKAAMQRQRAQRLAVPSAVLTNRCLSSWVAAVAVGRQHVACAVAKQLSAARLLLAAVLFRWVQCRQQASMKRRLGVVLEGSSADWQLLRLCLQSWCLAAALDREAELKVACESSAGAYAERSAAVTSYFNRALEVTQSVALQKQCWTAWRKQLSSLRRGTQLALHFARAREQRGPVMLELAFVSWAHAAKEERCSRETTDAQVLAKEAGLAHTRRSMALNSFTQLAAGRSEATAAVLAWQAWRSACYRGCLEPPRHVACWRDACNDGKQSHTRQPCSGSVLNQLSAARLLLAAVLFQWVQCRQQVSMKRRLGIVLEGSSADWQLLRLCLQSWCLAAALDREAELKVACESSAGAYAERSAAVTSYFNRALEVTQSVALQKQCWTAWRKQLSSLRRGTQLALHFARKREQRGPVMLELAFVSWAHAAKEERCSRETADAQVLAKEAALAHTRRSMALNSFTQLAAGRSEATAAVLAWQAWRSACYRGRLRAAETCRLLERCLQRWQAVSHKAAMQRQRAQRLAVPSAVLTNRCLSSWVAAVAVARQHVACAVAKQLSAARLLLAAVLFQWVQCRQQASMKRRLGVVLEGSSADWQLLRLCLQSWCLAAALDREAELKVAKQCWTAWRKQLSSLRRGTQLALHFARKREQRGPVMLELAFVSWAHAAKEERCSRETADAQVLAKEAALAHTRRSMALNSFTQLAAGRSEATAAVLAWQAWRSACYRGCLRAAETCRLLQRCLQRWLAVSHKAAMQRQRAQRLAVPSAVLTNRCLSSWVAAVAVARQHVACAVAKQLSAARLLLAAVLFQWVQCRQQASMKRRLGVVLEGSSADWQLLRLCLQSWCLAAALDREAELKVACESSAGAYAERSAAVTSYFNRALEVTQSVALQKQCWTAWRKQLSSLRRGTQLALHFARAGEQRGPVMLELAFVSWAHTAKEERCSRETADAQVLAKEAALAHTRRSMALNSFTQLAAGRSEAIAAVLAWQAWRSACYRGRLRAAETCRLLERCLQRWQAVSHKAAMQRQRAQRLAVPSAVLTNRCLSSWVAAVAVARQHVACAVAKQLSAARLLLAAVLFQWVQCRQQVSMKRRLGIVLEGSSADWQLLRLCLQSWCLAAALDREAELKVACESSAGAYAERSAAVTSYFNRALEVTQSVALQKQCWTAWRKQLSSLRRGTQLALHFARAREQRGPVMLELAFVSWAHAAKEERCSRETTDAQVLAKEAGLAHTRRSMALNSFTQLAAGRSEATAAVLAWQAWRSACYRGCLGAAETCRLLERCLQRWQAVSHKAAMQRQRAQRLAVPSAVLTNRCLSSWVAAVAVARQHVACAVAKQLSAARLLLAAVLFQWVQCRQQASMKRRLGVVLEGSSADWQLLRLCLQSWCLAAALDREAELKVACESSAGAYAERSAAVTSYFNRALEATQSVALQKQCWTAWRKKEAEAGGREEEERGGGKRRRKWKQLSSLSRGNSWPCTLLGKRGEQRRPVICLEARLRFSWAKQQGGRCSRDDGRNAQCACKGGGGGKRLFLFGAHRRAPWPLILSLSVQRAKAKKRKANISGQLLAAWQKSLEWFFFFGSSLLQRPFFTSRRTCSPDGVRLPARWQAVSHKAAMQRQRAQRLAVPSAVLTNRCLSSWVAAVAVARQHVACAVAKQLSAARLLLAAVLFQWVQCRQQASMKRRLGVVLEGSSADWQLLRLCLQSWCLAAALDREAELKVACESSAGAYAERSAAVTSYFNRALEATQSVALQKQCWTAWRKQLSSLHRGTQLALHFARAREQRGPVMLELAFVSWAHAAKEERCSRETADAQVLAKEAALAHTRRSMALNSFTQLAAGRSEATAAVLAWQAWRSACYRGRLRAAETCRLLERCLQRWQAVSHKAAMQRQRAQRLAVPSAVLTNRCLSSWVAAVAVARQHVACAVAKQLSAARLLLAAVLFQWVQCRQQASMKRRLGVVLEGSSADWQLLRLCLQSWCLAAALDREAELKVACESSAGAYAERSAAVTSYFNRALEATQSVALQKQCWTAWRKQLSLGSGLRLALRRSKRHELMMLELTFILWAKTAKEERCLRATAYAHLLLQQAALAHTRRSMALNSFTQLAAGRNEATAAVLAWQAWRSACYRGRLRAAETCRLLERCLQRWQEMWHEARKSRSRSGARLRAGQALSSAAAKQRLVLALRRCVEAWRWHHRARLTQYQRAHQMAQPANSLVHRCLLCWTSVVLGAKHQRGCEILQAARESCNRTAMARLRQSAALAVALDSSALHLVKKTAFRHWAWLRWHMSRKRKLGEIATGQIHAASWQVTQMCLRCWACVVDCSRRLERAAKLHTGCSNAIAACFQHALGFQTRTLTWQCWTAWRKQLSFLRRGTQLALHFARAREQRGPVMLELTFVSWAHAAKEERCLRETADAQVLFQQAALAHTRRSMALNSFTELAAGRSEATAALLAWQAWRSACYRGCLGAAETCRLLERCLQRWQAVSHKAAMQRQRAQRLAVPSAVLTNRCLSSWVAAVAVARQHVACSVAKQLSAARLLLAAVLFQWVQCRQQASKKRRLGVVLEGSSADWQLLRLCLQSWCLAAALDREAELKVACESSAGAYAERSAAVTSYFNRALEVTQSVALQKQCWTAWRKQLSSLRRGTQLALHFVRKREQRGPVLLQLAFVSWAHAAKEERCSRETADAQVHARVTQCWTAWLKQLSLRRGSELLALHRAKRHVLMMLQLTFVLWTQAAKEERCLRETAKTKVLWQHALAAHYCLSCWCSAVAYSRQAAAAARAQEQQLVFAAWARQVKEGRSSVRLGSMPVLEAHHRNNRMREKVAGLAEAMELRAFDSRPLRMGFGSPTNSGSSLAAPHTRAGGHGSGGLESLRYAVASSLDELVEKGQLECLNEDKEHPVAACMDGSDAVLASDRGTDNQLLIKVQFRVPVKLQSIRIVGNSEDGSAPQTVKLYLDKVNMGFEDTEEAGVQELTLTAADVDKGEPIPLRFVKFQSVKSLQIFVQDNFGSDVTKIKRLEFLGQPTSNMDMKDWKPVKG